MSEERGMDEIGATLAAHRRKRRRTRVLAAVVIVVGVAGTVLAQQLFGGQKTAVEYDLVEADRGAIVSVAIATGSLEPQRTVEIGAEISGEIATVEVDANDLVRKGQVLATFDLASLDNALKQARATVSAARADVKRAEAALELARSTRDRLDKLVDRSAIAARDFDEARIGVTRADADLAAARAQLQLAQTRLELAQTNRDKAVIESPIDGVVLQRSVEPGNTVASSFQAPTLFVIAESLDRMELHVAIDEADVGEVKDGARATFKVDAWPARTFEATVDSVHLYPTVANSVVTYEALLTVDNSEGLLRPGMTATATIVTGRREDVLRVPNGALGYTPASTTAAGRQSTGLLMTGPPRRRPQGNKSSRKAVWVLRDGAPVQVSIATGATDGTYTEVLEGELAAGESLIVGEKTPARGAPKAGARP